MALAQSAPAWASTAVGPLLAGEWRTGTVLAAGGVASYVTFAEPTSPLHLLALLDPAAVRLPLGMCVPGMRLPRPDSPVRVGHGVVAVADRSWRPVRWWEPRPRIAAAALLRNGGALLDVVCREPEAAFGLPVVDALDIARALAAGAAGPALDVLGLGPGLTPAGDDVVAGALAVLALLGRLDESVRVAIQTYARTRTVALSAALLEAAGRAQMIPQAARTLTAVAAGEPRTGLAAAAADLFGVGSTSGHDLCAGMAGALAGLQ